MGGGDRERGLAPGLAWPPRPLGCGRCGRALAPCERCDRLEPAGRPLEGADLGAVTKESAGGGGDRSLVALERGAVSNEVDAATEGSRQEAARLLIVGAGPWADGPRDGDFIGLRPSSSPPPPAAPAAAAFFATAGQAPAAGLAAAPAAAEAAGDPTSTGLEGRLVRFELAGSGLGAPPPGPCRW